MRLLVCLAVLLSGIQVTTPAAQAAPAATGVTANFGVNGGPGHAEVFGSGINVPALEDSNKIETLHQSGTRFVRRDAYLHHILPRDTTIEAYLADLDSGGAGVANPDNWDWSNYGWVDQHKPRGAKVLMILSYTTQWLGYTPGAWDQRYFSPPRGPDGFRVYRDAVKKIYQRFRGKVDLIEVWNEPNIGFIDTTNSPYPNSSPGRLAAYKEIYYHAATAIREVDSTIPIGGPSLSNQSLTQELPPPALPGVAHWVRDLFADPRLYPKINFLSYHSYNDYASFKDEVVSTWKQAARDAGKGDDFPVYVTEWNYSAAYADVPMNGNHPHTIAYTANRLTHFYKQHANGTNFFADNDESIVWEFFGVHRNGSLPPKARTYRLLSQDLGLGAGPSTVRPISYGAPVSNAGAATTASGEHVAWIVNDGTAPIDVDLNLTGLGGITATRAHIFEASGAQTAESPKASIPLTVSGGSATVRFGVPAKAVTGVRLAPYAIGDSANLAPSATVTPSSVTAEHPQLVAANAIDGSIGHANEEWASARELNPWLRLDWPTARTVGRVVLFDRFNPIDHVASGRLVFSDGSTVPIPALPNDGTGKSIAFAPRSVTSVRIELSGGSGSLNIGLGEVQVFADTNVAPNGTVTASSGTASHVKAIDGIVGAAGEWVSTQADPWIRIAWVHPQTIDSVVLHDRPDGSSNANGGTLTFSDGSTVAVSGIPADGSAKTVTFPARTVTSVRFNAAGSGSSVGLAELRVLRSANVGSSAVVTATSVSPDDPTLVPANATDGVVNQWFAGEWASNREVNPRIRMTWATPQVIDQVVIYDRMNMVDHAAGGTLSFSSGGTIAVSGIGNTGVGKVVSFAPRTVTWVELAISGAAGTWNGGLAEFEAYSRTAVLTRRNEAFSAGDSPIRTVPRRAPAPPFGRLHET